MVLLSYKKKTLLLIAIATLIRCIAACSIGLGNDEVYYRIYAQDLQWNYFDHPPMVGWLIRVTTFNLLLDNSLFIRLGAIIAAAITTWLFFLCGKKLVNDYTGFLAALIYTATIYGSIIAGTFILPDSPQMVFWSAGLYLLIDLTKNESAGHEKNKKVLWFGVIAGFGMLCKIHTFFLWFGLLLYVLLCDRRWLKKPSLYLSGVISLLFFFPVLKWNVDNHFVTYLYHSKRINISTGGLDMQTFFSFIAGQLLYCNPVIFFFILLATVSAFRNRLPIEPSQKWLLLFCSLPLIGIALAISLFKEVLPHWSGPAYSGLILLTASYFAKPSFNTTFDYRIIPKPLLFANSLTALIISGGILIVNFLPGTMGKKNQLSLGDGDFTLDMYGWNDLKTSFEKLVQHDLQSGSMKSDAVIISNKWFTAAHLDYYVAMPIKKDLVAIGDTSSIHQYAWLNKKRKSLVPGDDAYCIVPSENYLDAEGAYASLFKEIEQPLLIEQKRNGKACRIFYVYKMKSYSGK